jgi:predicted nucleic acid-binding protein
MIVVADTTPLRYLILIGREELLPALYGRVLIPVAVADELSRDNTPSEVRSWMSNRPEWLEIRRPEHALNAETDLGAGECEAIALAEELIADLLLVDDTDARREAARRHLRVVGTLRVLADGARLGLTNLEDDFQRLLRTNFRVSRELLNILLEEQRNIRKP